MEEKDLNVILEKFSTELAAAQATSTEKFLEKLAEVNDNLKQIVASNPVAKDKVEELRATNPAFRLASYVSAIKRKDSELLGKFEAEEKAVTTAMNETTNTAGQYLVPALTDASLRELMATVGQALKLFNVIPLGNGNPINFPKVATGSTSYIVGEQSAVTQSAVVLGVDTLTPYKFCTQIPLSNELLLDANIPIGSYLLSHMARGEMALLDNRCFQYSNTTWPGVFYASNVFGATQDLSSSAPTSITYANLVACALGVDLNYNINPAWNLSPSMLGVILSLVDAVSGRPIFDYNTKSMLGYPVNIIMAAPTSATVVSKPVVLFGDLKNSLLGDVQGRRVAIDETGSVTINGSAVSLREYDLALISSFKRYSFAPGLTGAYSICKTKSS